MCAKDEGNARGGLKSEIFSLHHIIFTLGSIVLFLFRFFRVVAL